MFDKTVLGALLGAAVTLAPLLSHAAPVTYEIVTDRFDARFKPGASPSGVVFNPTAGGKLSGSLTFDFSLAGVDRLVAFDITSELRFDADGSVVDVTAIYNSAAPTSGGAPDFAAYTGLTVAENGDAFTLTSTTRSYYTPWSIYTPGIRTTLVLDFGTLGAGNAISFDSTEFYNDCASDFTPEGYSESCDAFRGGNGADGNPAGVIASGFTAETTAVPLPAGLPLVLAGGAALGLLSRRARKPV